MQPFLPKQQKAHLQITPALSAANSCECVGREMPNQVGFRLVPDIFPVCFLSTHQQLSLSLFHCLFATCGYQKGAGCHTATSCRDSSGAPYPRAVRSHIPGGGLYPPGLCFRDGEYGILIRPLPGVSSLSPEHLNPPSWGGGCHMLVVCLKICLVIQAQVRRLSNLS